MNRNKRVEWDSALRDFEAWLTYERRKPRTIEAHLYRMRNFADSVSVGPADVTPLHVVRYLAKGHWKPHTQNAARNGLRAFFKWASTAGRLIESDPTSDLRRFQVPAPEPVRISRSALMEAIGRAPERSQLMAELAALVDLRAGEIAVLRTTDLERDPQGGYYVTVSRKARQVQATVPTQLATRLLDRPKGYIFPGRISGRVSQAYVSKLISRALPNDWTAEVIRGVLAPTAIDHHHQSRTTRLASAPLLVANEQVQLQLIYIERDLETNPGNAISECKDLLEQAFKLLLDERQVAYSRTDEIKDLWTKVATSYGLLDVKGNSAARADVKMLTRNLGAILDGISNSRNDMGTSGHGHVVDRGAELRHARLVFNATVAMAEFLVDGLAAGAE